MLVFIDGLDDFEDYYQPYNLAWLSKIPKVSWYNFSLLDPELIQFKWTDFLCIASIVLQQHNNITASKYFDIYFFM